MSSEVLTFVLGLATTVIVWILRVAFIRRDQHVPAWVYNIVLGVVALALAVAFGEPLSLPPFPEFDGTLIGFLSALIEHAGNVLPALAGIMVFSKVIYEDLLERVLKELGGFNEPDIA